MRLRSKKLNIGFVKGCMYFRYTYSYILKTKEWIVGILVRVIEININPSIF